MEDEEQKKSEQQPEPTDKPSTLPVDNNTDKIEEGDKKSAEKADNGNAESCSQQPFLVKVEKEKGKGLSKAETISLFGILISGSLFFMTLKSFQKTKKSVEISESALNDSRINQRRRDSLDSIKGIKDYIRDTTNIGLSKQTLKTQADAISSSDSMSKKTIDVASQSLKTQITTFNENRKAFEEENRPLIQIVNLTVDSVEVDKMPVINYVFVNYGKFPGKMTDVEMIGRFTNEKAEGGFDTVALSKGLVANATIANNTQLKSSVAFTVKFNKAQIEKYKLNEFFFYLFLKYKYENFVTHIVYYSYSIWKIQYREPVNHIVALRNDDQPIPIIR